MGRVDAKRDIAWQPSGTIIGIAGRLIRQLIRQGLPGPCHSKRIKIQNSDGGTACASAYR